VKNIPDILNKKFIFVPINATLHWSLAVIVNPGAYLNGECDGIDEAALENLGEYKQHVREGADEMQTDSAVMAREKLEKFAEDTSGCTILFLDSLHAHNKNRVSSHLFAFSPPPVPPNPAPRSTRTCSRGSGRRSRRA
jgi:Ulp1 family protease